MASTKQIRIGLAAALKKQFPEGYQISAYAMSAPLPPAMQVMPGPIDYHEDFGDGSMRVFVVTAFLALTSDIGAQEKADVFFENDLLKAALEADSTLGGVCDDLIVDRAEPRFYEIASLASPLVGGDWTLRILT
jgi:hypothetical protein